VCSEMWYKRQAMAGVPVTISCEVLPQVREF
jgi:hypothetical protein